MNDPRNFLPRDVPLSSSLPTQQVLPTFADLYPNLAAQGYRGMQLMEILDAIAGRWQAQQNQIAALSGDVARLAKRVHEAEDFEMQLEKTIEALNEKLDLMNQQQHIHLQALSGLFDHLGVQQPPEGNTP